MKVYSGGNVCVYKIENECDIEEVMSSIDIDRFDIESVLDCDEISRIEFLTDGVFIIWKQPKHFDSGQDSLRLGIYSIGVYLRTTDHSVSIIFGEDFDMKCLTNVNSAVNFMLKLLFDTTRHFVSHLKVVKQITKELESKISTSMENRYLLQMFTLGESLTYYLTAIEANGAVLSKLLSKSSKLGFDEDQIELLEDVTQENNQCVRQVQIYSNTLSGLMDARGTIVNNNMNVMLKNLTLINVIFLPLNLLASIGGMSEYSMMTSNFKWWVSYPLFLLSMFLCGSITWFILKKYLRC